MKKITISFVLVLVLVLNSSPLISQCELQRTSVNDLSNADQIELRNLILEYLQTEYDPNQNGIFQYPIVVDHIVDFGLKHNNDEKFATWHRAYVQELEGYILSQGVTKFIPLPYYNPENPIPNPFFNSQGSDGLSSTLPDFDELDDQTPNIDYSQYDENLNCDDWTDADDFVGTMEFFQHDPTHTTIGGPLSSGTTSPTTSIFWLIHAYITDLHACYLRECEGEKADIYVRDNAPDDGSEPTIQSTELWTSPDIWVRNQPDGFENTSVEELCFKINEEDEVKPVYVYVRTWNRGEVPSKNNENDLKIYWAKPSAGLSWPAPWNGQPTSNSCGLPVGGFIDSQPLRSVNGRYFDEFDVDRDGDSEETIEGYTIYEFEWLPPDPSLYVDCFGDGWEKGHFCIHARVDDGDSWNLTGNFYTDLVQNNDFALKNLYIYGEDDENEVCDNIEWLIPPGDDCVFFGNYTDDIMQNVALEISFPTIEEELLLTNNEIVLTLKDGGMFRWHEGGNLGQGIEYVEGDNSIRFIETNGRIDGMVLQPMEVYRFCVEITGDPLLTNGRELKFDIVQTVDGVEVGGERFLVKKVALPIELRSSQMDAKSMERSEYSVFPNPSRGEFTIGLNNGKDQHTIYLLNSLGQTIKSYKGVIGEISVNAVELGNGIFFINIENNTTGKIVNQKIIIE